MVRITNIPSSSLIVSAWCLLAVISALVSVRVEIFQIPIMVALNSFCLFVFSWVMEKRAMKEAHPESFKMEADEKLEVGQGSLNVLHDKHFASASNNAGPSFATTLILAHMVHQYTNFAIGFWIGNAHAIQVIRSLEPSLTYLLFSTKYVQMDATVHTLTTVVITAMQLWTTPTSNIGKMIAVILNSMLLSYRNKLLRRMYSVPNSSHELTLIFRKVSIFTAVIMFSFYITVYAKAVHLDWQWKWMVFACAGHSTYLAFNVFLMKNWDTVLYSSASILKRAFVTIFLMCWSWYFSHLIPYQLSEHFTSLLVGLLGVSAGSYVCLNHCFPTMREVFVKLSFYLMAVIIYMFLLSQIVGNHLSSQLISTNAFKALKPIRVAIYTAAGNGNLGDNLQIHAWLGHFKSWNERNFNGKREVDIYSLSAEFCCYPFDDRRKFVVDTVEALHKFLADHKPHYMMVGGGGIFNHPHYPWAIHRTWNDTLAFFPDTAWVFASVGASEGEYSVQIVSNTVGLLNHSLVVAARDLSSQQVLRESTSSNVILLRDPVLLDSMSFPFPPEKNITNKKDGITCWILRQPIPESLAKIMDQYMVLERDLFFAMEQQDGNFYGRFKKEVSVYSTESEWFWSNIQNCDYIVSMRYHGAILGLRARVPTFSIEFEDATRSSHKIGYLYEDLFGHSDCVLKHVDAKEFHEKFNKCKHQNIETFIARAKELEREFASFMDSTFK
ncbi:hypothetical protein C9374_000690 [Naegleria lovaniensis]|uniref:Polysaccharide pyruvyl transferase domain-containing protein n=1 Tax=Naegleria lovaniensis TaxID=51637 RepID=A0AA88KPE4_NAELO|nr:uncharacterized protein C9374_000690 [Naegleria lovaniensis]KAG2388526.1 hypothetical protein C9374_000690 [Naegleria lovaniensis]